MNLPAEKPKKRLARDISRQTQSVLRQNLALVRHVLGPWPSKTPKVCVIPIRMAERRILLFSFAQVKGLGQ